MWSEIYRATLNNDENWMIATAQGAPTAVIIHNKGTKPVKISAGTKSGFAVFPQRSIVILNLSGDTIVTATEETKLEVRYGI